MKIEIVAIVIVALFLTSFSHAVTKISGIRDFTVKGDLAETTYDASVGG